MFDLPAREAAPARNRLRAVVPLRVLADKSRCSPDALHRHRRRHLSPQLAAAILAAQRPSAVDLEALQRSESQGPVIAVCRRKGPDYSSTRRWRSKSQRGGRDLLPSVASPATLSYPPSCPPSAAQHHQVTRMSLLFTPDYSVPAPRCRWMPPGRI